MKNVSNKVILAMEQPFVHMTWVPYNHLIVIAQREKGFRGWFLNTMVNVIAMCANVGAPSTPFLTYAVYPEPSSMYCRGNIWDLCPFIHKLTVSREFLMDMNINVVDFLIKMIEKGNYIYIYLKRPEEFVHQQIVYGFDLNKGVIYLADFFENVRYGIKEMPISDIEKAYAVEESDVPGYASERFKYIYLARPKQHKHDFSLNILQQSINDYLSSTNSFGIIDSMLIENNVKYNNSIYYGISSCTPIIDYLIRKKTDSIEPYMDYTLFSFLNDSKNITSLLIEYLYQCSFIKDESKITEGNEMVNISNKILNMCLKYNVNKNTQIIDRIIDEINRLKLSEESLLKSLLNEVSTIT